MKKFINFIITKTNNNTLTQDYRSLVIGEFLVILAYFIFPSFLNLLGIQVLLDNLNLFLLVFAASYFFMLWNLLRQVSKNDKVIFMTFIILCISYILGFLVENPLFETFSDKRAIYFIIHASLIVVECFVISLAIRDIFVSEDVFPGKIWGAACIYLTIGISFGSVYDLINIIQPGSFGHEVALGFPSYIEGIYYSLSTLSGLDSSFSSANQLTKNLTVFEALVGNLYLVFLIGSIITKKEIYTKGK